MNRNRKWKKWEMHEHPTYVEYGFLKKLSHLLRYSNSLKKILRNETNTDTLSRKHKFI